MSREGDVAELVREGEVDFAKPLPRALLRDRRLSWAARGLFAFLWDLPRGWRPRIAHLVGMGIDGRDAVRARLAELESVGALRVEAMRGEGGRLEGKRWVLVAAERWAVESALDSGGKTEDRKIRSSVNPKVGKSNAKVHQLEGSPIKRPAGKSAGAPSFVVANKSDPGALEASAEKVRREMALARQGAA